MTLPFDVKSIMKYYFPSWMFVNGDKSHCYGPQNLEISANDEKGAALAYPKNPQDVNNVISKQKMALNAILELKGLQPGTERKYREFRDSLPK